MRAGEGRFEIIGRLPLGTKNHLQMLKSSRDRSELIFQIQTAIIKRIILLLPNNQIFMMSLPQRRNTKRTTIPDFHPSGETLLAENVLATVDFLGVVGQS